MYNISNKNTILERKNKHGGDKKKSRKCTVVLIGCEAYPVRVKSQSNVSLLCFESEASFNRRRLW